MILDLESRAIPLSIQGKINLAVIYPNSYQLGISNLGFQTIHRIACQQPGIGVERVFPILPELGKVEPPFYSFESQRPLGDFDVFMFSFSFEGDFDAIPMILAPLGIPIIRRKRSSNMHPLLLGGGAAVAANPNALSDIFDLLVPGEAEPVLPEILYQWVNNGLSAESASTIKGVWAPGLCKKLPATPADAPDTHDVAHAPAWSHIITPFNVFEGAHLLEVMRGCPRTCAFCLARSIYSPPRPVPLSKIVSWLGSMPDCKELGLVAPSLFDHPELSAMLEILAKKKILVRNSSVKWERLTQEILTLLQKCEVKSLTLAPETGSSKLRQNMAKPMQEDAFLETIDRIFRHGFMRVKLYFIAGLPDEEIDDLDATVEFLYRISNIAHNVNRHITAAFSAFVPKRHTSWETKSFVGQREIKKRFRYLRKELQKVPGTLKLQFASSQEAARQAVLTKIGPELAEEYQKEAAAWCAGQVSPRFTVTDHDF